MKVYDFSCPVCAFESRNQVGTPDGDQTLTDVNTEFAVYELFACPQEKKFISVNKLDPEFHGRCPADGAELRLVNAKNAQCPRCGSGLRVEETKPLSAGDAASE